MLELLRGIGDPVKAPVDRHWSRSHARETLVLLAAAEEHSKEKSPGTASGEPSSSLPGMCGAGPVSASYSSHNSYTVLSILQPYPNSTSFFFYFHVCALAMNRFLDALCSCWSVL